VSAAAAPATPAFDYAAHGLRAPDRRPAIPGGGPQSVASVLDRPLAERPDAEALVGRHGRLSFAQLDAAANAAAAALAALGVRAGDRVAACLPNDVDLVVAFLGCMRLGALWVGVNRALAPPEKAYLLRDAGASVWLAAPEAADSLAAHRAELPDLARVVLADPGGARDAWRARLAAAAGAPRPAAAIDPFAPAAIAYTSGTTGHPKGAVHSQHNLLLPGAVSRATGRYAPGLRIASVLPLTILNLVVLGPLTAWQMGSAFVAIDRIDPLGLAEWIRRERVGSFAGVPTIFHDLLTHPGVTPGDLASLVAPEVGGAECPEEFRALYRERFGAEVRIGYGMTEAPTAVSWSDGRAAPEPGLCGRAQPQLEIAILDEQGRRAPRGEVGEICVGPSHEGLWAGVYTPMLGYWRRPEATAEALRGGLYHSGDLGLLDAEGTLYIRGRRSELILRGGANVYPAEVERALAECPGVAGCAVLGIPDARLGQRVAAAVEPEPGASLSPEALAAWLAPRLARYKIPDRIAIVTQLPRNAMSKVIKRELAPLFEDAKR
jgi:acyl-CoA synthetase (AMP-forming)/AMP-acid ligase II